MDDLFPVTTLFRALVRFIGNRSSWRQGVALALAAADPSLRAISTSHAVLTALRERNRAQSRRSSDTRLIVPASDTPTLQTVDYTARLPDKEYDEQLAEWQSRLEIGRAHV